MRRIRYSLFGSASLVASFVLAAQSTTANAQQVEAPPSTASSRDQVSQESQSGLQDIVVTALRRATDLQQTPIAVTAFGGESLEQARVQNFGDLATKIPGFSINSYGRSRANPALRGGSSSLTAPGSDNAVALFVDDIYYGSSGDFELDLFDLERVEVLRGPQGTLFGRNSTGGSIAIITKDPSEVPEGAIEASVGNYDMLQARGYITGPLDEAGTILGSLAFTGTNRAGTSFNRTEGRRVDTTNRASVRAKLKFLLSDEVNLVLAGDYSRISETNEARDYRGANPTIDSLEQIGFQVDDDRRVVDVFDNGTFESTSWGVSAKLDADLGVGTFISITGFRKLDTKQSPADALGLAIPFLTAAEPRRLDQFSQEFRWVSPSEGRFTYVAGLYFLYQKDRRHQHFQTFFDPSSFAGALQAATFCPLQGDELNFATPACVAARPDLFGQNRVETFQDSSVYSYAAYLQGTYEISDQLHFTLGGRITRDRKTASGFTRGDRDFIFNPIEVAGGFEGTPGGYRVAGLKKSWTAFTPKATLDWTPSRSLMFYGTVSKGYRSGAFQLEATEAGAVIPIEPEFVWNYELGFKSRFLDNRAQLNVAVFQANYRNLQFSVTDANTGELIVDNAGKARVRGVEVEATLEPLLGLTVSANYSYQSGRVSGFPAEAGERNGLAPAQMPRHTLNLGANYDIGLAGGGTITLAGDFQYKERYQLELDADPALSSRVKSLINANIGYTTPNGKWRFTIWGKNLTNETIVAYGQNFRLFAYSFDEAFNPASPNFDPAAASAGMPRYAPPRTYGATVRMDF